MMAGYVDVAEECGAAVDAGHMDRDTAILAIFTAAAGGLTMLGAESVLDQWQTLRGRFGDILMSAELGIAACQAATRLQEQDPS